MSTSRRDFCKSGISLLVLSGCGGGGQSDPLQAQGNGPAAPLAITSPTALSPSVPLVPAITSLDTPTPKALSALTVRTIGIDTSTPMKVIITDSSGYTATITPMRADADGNIIASMPLRFDPATQKTNDFVYQIAVVQGPVTTAAPMTVTVKDMAQATDFAMSPGEISRSFLNYQQILIGSIINSMQVRQNTAGNKTDLSAVINRLKQRLLAVILARNDIDRIITDSAVKIPIGTSPSGTLIAFDKSSVEMMDRVIGVHLTNILATTSGEMLPVKASRLNKDFISPLPKTIKSLLNSITTVSGAAAHADAVRGLTEPGKSQTDQTLAAIAGASAIIGVAAPKLEITALIGGAVLGSAGLIATSPAKAVKGVAAGIVGAVAAVAVIGMDIIHLHMTSNEVEEAQVSGANLATLTVLIKERSKQYQGLAFDSIGAGLSALVGGQGEKTAELLFEGGEVSNTIVKAQLTDTGQLVAQTVTLIVTAAQIAGNVKADMGTNNTSIEEHAVVQIGVNSGIGTIDGLLANPNPGGSIFNRLGEASISISGRKFTSISDVDGNYRLNIPLGNSTLDYFHGTLEIADPVTTQVISSRLIDLSGVTNTTPLHPGVM